jgi:hypothetical protein
MLYLFLHSIIVNCVLSIREKFGVYEDPLYVCYPEGSLGIQGIEAIMRSVKDPESKRKKKRRLRSNDSKATASDGTDASVRSGEDSTIT